MCRGEEASHEGIPGRPASILLRYLAPASLVPSPPCGVVPPSASTLCCVGLCRALCGAGVDYTAACLSWAEDGTLRLAWHSARRASSSRLSAPAYGGLPDITPPGVSLTGPVSVVWTLPSCRGARRLPCIASLTISTCASDIPSPIPASLYWGLQHVMGIPHRNSQPMTLLLVGDRRMPRRWWSSAGLVVPLPVAGHGRSGPSLLRPSCRGRAVAPRCGSPRLCRRLITPLRAPSCPSAVRGTLHLLPVPRHSLRPWGASQPSSRSCRPLGSHPPGGPPVPLISPTSGCPYPSPPCIASLHIFPRLLASDLNLTHRASRSILRVGLAPSEDSLPWGSTDVDAFRSASRSPGRNKGLTPERCPQGILVPHPA